jgi:ammonia channel protein AmtB
MSDTSKWAHIGLIVVMLAFFGWFCVNIGRNNAMANSKYTLETYTGVGSGVLKHGTIVKVVDGKATVVGHFDDDSGKDYPGTVEIKEVQ